jgi:mono/diheme cytochrome c family protein
MIHQRTIGTLAVLAGASLSVSVGLTEFALAHGEEHNRARFEYVRSSGVPAEYAERLNPLRATPEALASGKELYGQNCAFCHGESGHGDGEMAPDLDPKPAAITGMYDASMVGMDEGGPGTHLMHGVEHHHPGLTHAEAMGGVNLDAYMFWAVSEGGEAMGSAMPPFKDALSEEELWQILLYVANDFRAEVN